MGRTWHGFMYFDVAWSIINLVENYRFDSENSFE